MKIILINLAVGINIRNCCKLYVVLFGFYKNERGKMENLGKLERETKKLEKIVRGSGRPAPSSSYNFIETVSLI